MAIKPPSGQWMIGGKPVGPSWLEWFTDLWRALKDGDDTDFTVLTAIQAGGGGGLGIQYKTRALTLSGGVITTVGTESGWNDI